MRLHLAFFLAAYLSALPAVSAERLQAVKELRNANWEARCTIAPHVGNASLAVMGDICLATIGTSCQSDALDDESLCVRLPRTGGDYHAHIRKRKQFFQAKTLILRHNAQHFEVVADGLLLARVFAPQSFKGRLFASTGRDGRPIVQDVKYQRLEPVVFGDDFMRTEEEAQNLGPWNALSGDWKIYSVMERIQANPSARIRPGKIPVPDRSPNPFTLSGKSQPGEDAFIVTGQRYWNGYRVEATVKPALNSACGVLFSVMDHDNFWYCKWRPVSHGTHPVPLQLVQRIGGQDILRLETLVKGRANSFARLAVETVGQDIRVFLDNVQVMDFLSDSCTGGFIGLYASGAAETHFDDIAVSSIASLTPRTTHALKDLACFPYALTHYAMGNADFSMARNDAGDVLSLRPLRENATIAFGDDSWLPQRFAVAIRPSAKMLAGNSQKPDANIKKAGILFAHGTRSIFLNQYEGSLTLTLEDAKNNRRLQQLTVQRTAPCKPIDLAIDSSDKKVTEIWLDGVLAMRQDHEGYAAGGKIVLHSEGMDATFENPVFFILHRRHWEKPVDIVRFADDPFMQGWASSRYVWLRTQAPGVFPQTFQFTGDIYGAFTLKSPIIHGLDYVFGNDDLDAPNTYRLKTALQEKEASATLTLLKGNKSMMTAQLSNLKHEHRAGVQIVDEKIGARPRTPDTDCWGDFTLHRDGYVIWIEKDGKCVAYATDSSPYAGRALSVNVPAPMDFIHIDVCREHVLDYLFENAEADFNALGRWEVTNRFACDPRWSHLNGESFGTASLVSKYDVKGDFTIECFAGMRMRQGEMKEDATMSYPRVGDINVAFQTSEHSLFDGYNLIIQGWDDTWSESQTRFLRKGDVLATSSEQLIPSGRRRAPRARVIPLDWDPGGRPVHGAWFAVKIRKSGSVFDVWLDHRHVFTVKDANPLEALGRIALWTQHNSIVLARVKVNYSEVFRPSPVLTPSQTRTARFDQSPQAVSHASAISKTAIPTSLTPLTVPNADQSASIDRLAWHNNDQAFLLQNANAGGDFGVRFTLPEKNRLLDGLSLEFDCALSDAARLNLYLEPKNEALPRLFIPLTGPENDGPDLRNIGRPMITVIKKRALDERDWCHVAIPLGTLFRQAYPFYNGSLDVEDAILGMLHEGYLNAGLGGNPRDAWCVLGNPVFYSPPADMGLSSQERPWLNPLSPANGQAWALDDVKIAYDGPIGHWPSLYNATLSANGQKMSLTEQNTEIREGVIFITPEFDVRNVSYVAFGLEWSHPVTGKPQHLAWHARVDISADKTPPTPPEILECATQFAVRGNWPQDSRMLATTSQTAYAYIRRPDGRPAVRARARLCGSPIGLPLCTDGVLDISRHPLLFFDMKLPNDTYVDMKATGRYSSCQFMLSDRESVKGTTAEVTGFKADGRWHTVQADLYANLYLSEAFNLCVPLPLHEIMFKNFGYCGSYPGACYELSNVRFANAATTRLPLVLHWKSFDLSGITQCAVKWSSNPIDEPDVPQDVADHSIAAPDLPQGLNFLHVKACDSNGNWSPATHQPFYIDNALPKIDTVSCTNGLPCAPETLTATLSASTFGLDASKATCQLNGSPVPLRDAELIYEKKCHRLILDITRLSSMFSRHLADGTAINVELCGMANAVGAPVPAIQWSWTTDYSKDKTPPDAPSIYMRHHAFKQYKNANIDRFAHRYLNARNATVVSRLDEELQAPCLDCVVEKGGQVRFMLPLPYNAFGEDARLLMFDLKLHPGTRANLEFFAGKTKQVIRLNGSTEEKSIGRMDGIADDGKWHTLVIDLKKDLRDKQTDECRKMPLSAFALDFGGRVQNRMHACLANVHVVHALPPVLSLDMAANDATGIDSINAAVTTAALPAALPPLPDSIAQERAPWYCLVTSAGLHYIHAIARDGAGNQSLRTTIPFICEAPVVSMFNDDTLDDFEKHSWSVRPLSQKKVVARLPVLQCLDSDEKHSKLLALVFRERTRGCILSTPIQNLPPDDVSLTLSCDLMLTGEKGSVEVSLVTLDKDGGVIAESPPERISCGSTWRRNVCLASHSSAETGKKGRQKRKAPSLLGFKCKVEKNCLGMLLLDNVVAK